MNFKKITAFVLSLTTLGSFTSLSAFAEGEETEKKPTYDYVALGDSITAGFGLENDGSITSLMTDRALILNRELIADPIKDAYPAVFGTYLAEAGKEYGYDVTATNLAATAYRAGDIEKIIREDNTKGAVAANILENFVGEGTSEALLPYHGIYEEYLPEAELVSIMLGGNDIIMGTLAPVSSSENPILKAMVLGFDLTLFGCDMKTAVGAALMKIDAEKENIGYNTVLEAFQCLADAGANSEKEVIISAENVKKVVEAVQEKNPDADIALLNMFNPYITEYNFGGAFCNIMREVFKKAIEDSIDISTLMVNPDDEIEIERLDADELIESDEEYEQASNETKKDVRRLKVLFKLNSLFENDLWKSEMEYLLQKLTDEAALPFVYTVMGKGSAPQIDSLNEKLLEISEEKGTYFVDVSGITPEANSDPHPEAEGHKEIADLMWATMQERIQEIISAEQGDPVDPIDPEDPDAFVPTFERQNLLLGGKISVNFYIDLSGLTEEEREASYVEFTVAGVKSVDNFDASDMNQTKQYYGFSCDVPSVGMADTITAVLHYGDDKTVTKNYTVEQYLNLFNEEDPEKLLNMIHAINDYGYYAQQYLSKSATSPWTIGVEHQAMEKAFHAPYTADEVNEILTAIQDKMKVQSLNEDIAKINYSLSMDSDTVINLFIRPYNGYNGNVSVEVDGVPVKAVKQSDGRYRISISGISPRLLGNMHHVVITSDSGTSTVDVSALSYVYDCLADPLSVEETNAMAATYTYYATTLAYLGY